MISKANKKTTTSMVEQCYQTLYAIKKQSNEILITTKSQDDPIKLK